MPKSMMSSPRRRAASLQLAGDVEDVGRQRGEAAKGFHGFLRGLSGFYCARVRVQPKVAGYSIASGLESECGDGGDTGRHNEQQRRTRSGRSVAAAVCLGRGGLQRSRCTLGRGGARHRLGGRLRRSLAAVQRAGDPDPSQAGDGDRVHAPDDERAIGSAADHSAAGVGFSQNGSASFGSKIRRCRTGADFHGRTRWARCWSSWD